jgi:hypothetical protein
MNVNQGLIALISYIFPKEHLIVYVAGKKDPAHQYTPRDMDIYI